MRLILSVCITISLASCGAVYIPAKVRTASGDPAVSIVEITQSSVTQANQADGYTPRGLPDVFRQSTGGGSIAPQATIPLGPAQQQLRPDALTLRAPPAVNRGPYVIGTGDVLVLATPANANTVSELSGLLAAQNRRQGYTVQDDGAITIPDAGRVRVGGLTLSETEDAIFGLLIDNQIDPSFSVEIAEFNSQRVSIGGAVVTASVIPIELNPLFLNEALAAAGGIDVSDPEFAAVRIYRNGALYQIPLQDYRRDSRWQRLELIAGDSIFVDTEYQLDRAAQYFEQQIQVAELRRSTRGAALDEMQAELSIRRSELDERRTNFERRIELNAVERDYVYITGEVAEPSRYPLPFEHKSTLADALFVAGGIAESTGNPGQIYVLRDTGSEAVSAFHLDGSNVVNLILATKFEMRPNDVVFVAEQPVTRWNRVVQQIVPSLLGTSLNAATN